MAKKRKTLKAKLTLLSALPVLATGFVLAVVFIAMTYSKYLGLYGDEGAALASAYASSVASTIDSLSQQVEAITEGRLSTAQLILPESELGQHAAGRIERIHHTMQRFLQMNLFQTYQNAYLYTERTLQDGGVRCEIVGMVDLEAYDYQPATNAPATTQTYPTGSTSNRPC